MYRSKSSSSEKPRVDTLFCGSPKDAKASAQSAEAQSLMERARASSAAPLAATTRPAPSPQVLFGGATAQQATPPARVEASAEEDDEEFFMFKMD